MVQCVNLHAFRIAISQMTQIIISSNRLLTITINIPQSNMTLCKLRYITTRIDLGKANQKP